MKGKMRPQLQRQVRVRTGPYTIYRYCYESHRWVARISGVHEFGASVHMAKALLASEHDPVMVGAANGDTVWRAEPNQVTERRRRGKRRS